MTDITSAKRNILNAAARVCTTSGASHLTLERVAETAGLSKGGLLYHYPNKRALLEGMLGYLITNIQARQRAQEQQLQDRARPFALSMLGELEQDPEERALAQALLAVAAEDPQLLEPARPVIKQRIERAQRESDVSVALLLAVEGVRFLSMLNLLPDEPGSTQQIFEQLQQLAEQPR